MDKLFDEGCFYPGFFSVEEKLVLTQHKMFKVVKHLHKASGGNLYAAKTGLKYKMQGEYPNVAIVNRSGWPVLYLHGDTSADGDMVLRTSYIMSYKFKKRGMDKDKLISVNPAYINSKLPPELVHKLVTLATDAITRDFCTFPYSYSENFSVRPSKVKEFLPEKLADQLVLDVVGGVKFENMGDELRNTLLRLDEKIKQTVEDYYKREENLREAFDDAYFICHDGESVLFGACSMSYHHNSNKWHMNVTKPFGLYKSLNDLPESIRMEIKSRLMMCKMNRQDTSDVKHYEDLIPIASPTHTHMNYNVYPDTSSFISWSGRGPINRANPNSVWFTMPR